VGDHVATSGGSDRVNYKYMVKHDGPMYAFNGDGNYFVTSSHPFMTTEGWKSMDPALSREELPGLVVSQLREGDVLMMEGGKEKLLTRIDSKLEQVNVYNFTVENAHEFYADGYLVHNIATNAK